MAGIAPGGWIGYLGMNLLRHANMHAPCGGLGYVTVPVVRYHDLHLAASAGQSAYRRIIWIFFRFTFIF